MLKIAEYLRAGCRVKILLADIHGFLDNLKAPIDLVKHRAQYYKFVILNLLKAVGVSIDRLEFVLGSTYQLTPAYQMDLLRLCTIVTMHDARKAGAEVVKQVENATLSGLIYPLMQTLDEEYLGVDAQFGGVDQRKIFTLAKDLLPKVGYKERAHLMNPMVPGLAGGKMSASDPDSKIDVLEAPDVVTKKLKKAHAAPKETEGNGILSFVQYVLLPAGALKTGKPQFTVERREGEPLVYDNIEKMQEDYRTDIVSAVPISSQPQQDHENTANARQLTPQLLKHGVTKALNELLAPVQAAYSADKEWQEIEALAYPPPPSEPKKVKKVKDKGTKAPKKDVVAQPDGSVEGGDKAEVDVGRGAAEAMKELSSAQKAVA